MPQLLHAEGETVPKLRFPEFRNAGGWQEDTFGRAATFINGKAYKQEELLDKGKYRVLRVGNFFSNKGWYYSNLELDENKYCDNGDLLYAWSASFGPRIWQGEKIIYHYHIWKVLERKGVNREFLFILLGYETERMKAQTANGLGLLHITKGSIEQWRCYIPKSKEQQKIADCLSSIDDLITAQAQKIESLKAHKKGLMQQLFPAEGETVPKLRFPEFRDKGKWSSEILEDVYDLKGTNSLSREKLNYKNGEVKNIHYGDIHTKFSTLFDIKKENIPFINASENLEKIKAENCCVEGDIIFADASEDLDDVGKSIEIVNLNNEKVLSGLHTILARQKDKK